MSQHPEFGLVLLFDLHGFEEPPYRAMLTAYEHHMRIDFTGYPKVLRKRWMGFFSRIIAVADAFDAMTSLRPYRAPLSYKEAINALRRASGSQFDPRLVEVFIPVCLSVNPEELVEKQQLQSSLQ